MQAANISGEHELLTRAEALLAARQVDAALVRFGQAEAIGADADRCAAGRWQCFMLKGDFSRAWLESDAIRGRGAHDPKRFWDGSSIEGKRLMLRCLHGYGDAIQMLRYAPLLRRRAAHLTVETAPRLLPLVSCFAGIDDVIGWGGGADKERAWEVQAEIMELPYIFRSTMDDLPAPARVRLPSDVVAKANKYMGDGVKPQVGLMWSAGVWNTSRSIPFDLLRDLICRDSVTFWSLNAGEESACWNEVSAQYGYKDNASFGDGLLPLAGVIANLDLVISVDTMAAHLAATFGIPTWTLLQRAADWRWMIGRNCSPWYPSMRLFRQHADGDWPELIHRVAAELSAWAATQAIEPGVCTP